MSELNPPQLEAVVHESGPLLVFAGAGSGKTRAITFRIANLLANHRVPPYRILAVTFTNKAAGEMRDRLEQLGGPGGHARPVDRHVPLGVRAPAAPLLGGRRSASARNFVIYDDADQKAVLGRVLKDMGLNDRELSAEARSLGLISREKREGTRPSESRRRRHRLESVSCDVYDRYEAALVAPSNAVDFDDLLLYMMRIAESETPRRSGAPQPLLVTCWSTSSRTRT